MVTVGESVNSHNMQVVFDAEVRSPELVERLAASVPRLREIMAGLRGALPDAPSCAVGPSANGAFYRLPNHFRSISYMLNAGRGPSGGVVVFKGMEPLLSDFGDYLDWMLRAPFRASPLPLGLHFPLDMRLPPGAMWIRECVMEQEVATELQGRYVRHFGRLARAPIPLLVLKMSAEQVAQYEAALVERVSGVALTNVRSKLADGLGVEIYYYPELPVRVADLYVGNVREAFKSALTPPQVETTCAMWVQLVAEMLSLRYMPYVPWHHGMGSCLDQGNACIDGGFNDMLTLVPFEGIPDDVNFRSSVHSSTKILAESVMALVAASMGVPLASDPETAHLGLSYVAESLRKSLQEIEGCGVEIDERLKRYVLSPTVEGIFQSLGESCAKRSRPAQFVKSVSGSTHVPGASNEYVRERVAGSPVRRAYV